MARRLRSSINTRTGRLKLTPQKKPYGTRTGQFARGVTMSYRRAVRGNGAWVGTFADGHGGNYDVTLQARADDFEDRRRRACPELPPGRRRGAGAGARPGRRRPTPRGRSPSAEAVDEFERDLVARDGLPDSAQRLRYHLSPALARKAGGAFDGARLPPLPRQHAGQAALHPRLPRVTASRWRRRSRWRRVWTRASSTARHGVEGLGGLSRHPRCAPRCSWPMPTCARSSPPPYEIDQGAGLAVRNSWRRPARDRCSCSGRSSPTCRTTAPTRAS